MRGERKAIRTGLTGLTLKMAKDYSGRKWNRAKGGVVGVRSKVSATRMGGERIWGRTLRAEGELSVAITICVRYRKRNGRRRSSGVF